VKGLSMKRGTVVVATLIAAPSLTKNEDKKLDPDMAQTKMGNLWNFGMKAHIGVDVDRRLVHAVECTTAKVGGGHHDDGSLYAPPGNAYPGRLWI